MAYKPIQTQSFPFEALSAHPELITDILSSHDRVPFFLERRGDTVNVGAAPSSSREVDQLLEEALAEYADMKRQGYGREDGFSELEAVQRELTKLAH